MGKNFQRGFLDFVPVLTPKQNGEGNRVKYIYKGAVYRALVSDHAYVWIKVVCALLTVCVWTIFLFAASRRVPSTSSMLVTLGVALSVFAAGYFTVGVVLFLLSKRELTSDSYNSVSKMLLRGSFCGVITFLLTFAATAVSIIRDSVVLKIFPTADILCLGCHLVCAAIFLIFNHQWRRIEFSVLAPEAKEVSKAKDEFDEMIEAHKHMFRKKEDGIGSSDFH